jgi:hypothetical protein
MDPGSLEALRREPHWSYSSLNTFLNVCALQWAFRYVYRHEPAFTPAALAFGHAFHKALEYAARLRQDGQQASPQSAADLFSDVLAQLSRVREPAVRYPEGEDLDALHQTGRRMVAAYLESSSGEERVVEVGRAFRVVLEDAEGIPISKPLIGEFDCLVEAGGRTLIVDWKTAARRWPEGKEHQELQPTCYLHAFRASAGRDALFRYDIVTKARTPALDQRLTVRHPEHTLRLTEQIRVAEKMIRAELFLPNEQSWACKDCPHSLACQAWHKERTRSLYNFRLAA